MMKILVTFEADSPQRLREQMLMFLDIKPPTLKEKIAAKAKAPEPPQTPVEVIEEVMDLPEEEFVKPEAKQAIDLQVLKEAQLDRLRELFNAGKGTFVRELLAKYGHGAKVFPEVEAKWFPEIKIEIDRELR